MLRLELTTAAALAACLCLATAAPAAADTRYASPTGTGTDCTEVTPCALRTAINPGHPGVPGDVTDIADGDTVIVGSGDYLVTSFTLRFDVDKDITVRGEPGQPRPTITSDVMSAVDPLFTVTAPGAVIEELRITVTGGQQPEGLEVLSSAAPSVVRDVYIEGVEHHSSGPLVTLEGGSTLERAELVRFDSTPPSFDGQTLNTTGDVLVRDSFIRNTGTEVAVRTSGPSTAARFRNVTVASGSTAIFGATGPQQVSIRNALIDGATSDLHVVNPGVEYSITHSNYDPAQVIEQLGANLTETPPNQDPTAAGFFPLLVDPVNGDFHQLAGSPTRNAGSPDAFTGAFDIDGQPRVMGSAIDIGGDEFFESPPAGTGSSPSAGTSTTASPPNDFEIGKLKRNKKKGTATLFVTFPGPGEYGLTGKGLKRIGLDSTAARASRATAGGVERLKVRVGRGKKAKRLRARLLDKGKAKAKVRVTYVPTGGTANTLSRKLKLIRK